jgi:hypothetical protein
VWPRRRRRRGSEIVGERRGVPKSTKNVSEKRSERGGKEGGREGGKARRPRANQQEEEKEYLLPSSSRATTH